MGGWRSTYGDVEREKGEGKAYILGEWDCDQYGVA